MAKRLIFLQLAPEFGGQKFGPFQGEIRLGSNNAQEPDRITLPEQLGVLFEHARLVRQSEDTMLLAPVDRSAHVYLFRADGRAPKQVTAPVTMTHGDGFSLVSSDGPKFFLLLERPKPVDHNRDKPNSALEKAAKNLSTGSIFKEIKRQGLARALTNKYGSMASSTWTFVKTGSFLRPRYIIMATMMVGGFVLALLGGAAIGGVGMNFKTQEAQQKFEQCQADKVALQDSSNTEMDLTDFMIDSLGKDEAWRKTLEDDKTLRDAVRKELKAIFAAPERYRWVYKNEGASKNPYQAFRKRLVSAGLPENLIRTLAYAAATESYIEEREWELVLDSTQSQACGRGPLLLTWQQAYHLRLDLTQYDAVFNPSIMRRDDPEAGVNALRITAGNPLLELDQASIKIASFSGGECFYIEGQDDRMDITTLVPALAKQLGPNASDLPGASDRYWQAMRLLKLYAADFEDNNFSALNFLGSKTPSAVLDLNSKLPPPAKDYALRNVATVIARAMAIPCISKLDKQTKAPIEEVAMDQPKSQITCLALNWYVDNDEGS